MWRIVLADWRRLLWIQLGGWAMGLFILLVIARSLNTECCLDDPERWPLILKVFFYAIAYGQSSAIIWAQLGGNNIYRHQRLLATLPLSQPELNLVHYLTGGLLLVAGLPLWVGTFYVWRSFGLAVEPWMVIFMLLAIINFLLLSMRNLFPRVLIPLVFAFVIVPGVEGLVRIPLEIMTTPLASLFLGVATVFFGWWVAKQPTPNWAPGWGGRSRSRGLSRFRRSS